MHLINEFGDHSGSKIKTQILTFNYVPSQEIKKTYKIKWHAKSIKYLGVTLTKRLSDLCKTNYDQIHLQISRDIQWNQFESSLGAVPKFKRLRGYLNSVH